MPRYKLTIEYDGTPYVGWQRQDNGPSVQSAVETAILSLTGETVRIRGAGRTDSGVHARGQVAHADLTRAWDAHTLRNALNAYLGQARERVVVLEAEQVPDDFDARFSAVRLVRVQKAGGKPLAAADFLRGTPVAAGTVIG